jgi:ribosomal protein S18 acetylase RimI-like enzyme
MPRTGARGEQPAVIIRAGTAADADRAAELHVGQISQGFLSLLGAPFLARLYRRICLDPTSFLITAEGPDRVVGFIAGSIDVPALYRSFLWRDGAVAGLTAWRPVVVEWRRILETLRHGSSGGTGSGRGAELLAVAVDGSWSGHGVGAELVAAFLAESSLRGCRAAHVVVASDNDGAVALYRRAGFVVADQFELHVGTASLLMQWDGTDPRPSWGGASP